MFINEGNAQGTLARDPQKVAEGVVILTLRIKGKRIDKNTGFRETFYPTFVIFGIEADKALKYLERGQEVNVKYALETRKKEINGETRYFEDKVVNTIQYGKKYEPRKEVVAVENNPFEIKEDI